MKDIKHYIELNHSELVRTPEEKQTMLPNSVTEGKVNERTIDKGVGWFEDTDKGWGSTLRMYL